jgi:aconitate hydratase
MKILLENLLAAKTAFRVTEGLDRGGRELGREVEPETEIAFMPARVVLQDFTGVPCVSTWRRCATRSCAGRRCHATSTR